MKKFVAVIPMMLAFVVPASAQAWQQVGPCRLHAYVPTVSGRTAVFDGKVDTCGGLFRQVDMTLEVCPQERVQLYWFQGPCDVITHHALGIETRYPATIRGRPNALRVWVWGRVRVGRRLYTASMYSSIRRIW